MTNDTSIVVPAPQDAQEFFPPTDKAEAAETIMGLGYNLVPAAGKKPLVEWKAHQTRRVYRHEWGEWRTNPWGHSPLNFLFLTGHKPYGRLPGLVVIEADDREALDFLSGRCPDTPLITRSKKGYHLFYRHPGEGVRVPNRVGTTVGGVEYKIDIRGDGGYVVAPGSTHPENGHIYRWAQKWTAERVMACPVFDPAWLPHEGSADDAAEYEGSGDRSHAEAIASVAVPISDRVDQAREWLTRQPGAVQGRGADQYCYRLTLRLLWDFALPDEAAHKLLCEWGERSDHVYENGTWYPWSAAEMSHKIRCALRADYDRELLGSKLDGDRVDDDEVSRVVGGWDAADEPDLGTVTATVSAAPVAPTPSPTPKPKAAKKEAKKSASTLLVELARDRCDLWHGGTGEDAVGYVTLRTGGHAENHPIRSGTFKRLMISWFLAAFGKAPGDTAVREARDTLDALAVCGGERRATYIRTARVGETILVDLGDADWRCVEITKAGWRVVPHPVAFVRPSNLGELPAPEPGGSIDDLRRFANADDASFRLLVGWLLDSLKGGGPFHVCVLHGEQGSAKSTTLSVLRALTDPVASRESEKGREPRDERDLAIEAAQCHVVSYDNVSKLPQWLSDAFCRIATGGALTTRKLYEDEALKRFSFVRPLLLSGIGNFVVAGDLANRALIVNLPPLTEATRLEQGAFWQAFEAARPKLLGALYTACAHGLGSGLRLDKLPRMADSYLWVAKCCGGLKWPVSDWQAAYDENRHAITENILDGDKAAVVIREWFAAHETDEVKVEPDDLLKKLHSWCQTHHPGWSTYLPQTSRKLSDAIERIGPYLRAAGVDAVRGKTNGRRVYRFRRVPAETGTDRPQTGTDTGTD